jgi:hypothetical protein
MINSNLINQEKIEKTRIRNTLVTRETSKNQVRKKVIVLQVRFFGEIFRCDFSVNKIFPPYKVVITKLGLHTNTLEI